MAFLSEELWASLDDEEYWLRYFWIGPSDDGGDDEVCVPYRAVFPLGRHALSLELDSWGADTVLVLDREVRGPAELGGVDSLLDQPVFRWEELELVSRAIGEEDEELPHPGAPLLWLAPFAPILSDEDAERATALFEGACDRLGVLDPAQRASVLDRLGRGDVWRWRNDPTLGYVLETLAGHPPDSYRRRDDTEFPFASFAELLDDVREIVGEPPPSPPAPPTGLQRLLRSLVDVFGGGRRG